jgi:hypothetical protein
VDTGGNVTGKLGEGQLDGREQHAREAKLALVIVFLSLGNAQRVFRHQPQVNDLIGREIRVRDGQPGTF